MADGCPAVRRGMLFVYMAIVFNDYQSSYGIGILLILLCILHMFVHLRFVYALLSSTTILIFYVIASYTYYNTVPGVILMVLAGNVMYAESNYWSEFLARQDFIRRLKRENEKVRTQQFLDNMLPPMVLQMIKQGSIVAHQHAAADVIFCDIVSFTSIASSIPAEDVVAVLNVMFSTYDALSTQYCVYKVETIGDCWMGCCGVVSHEVNHSQNIVDFALAMLKSTRGFRVQTGNAQGSDKTPAVSPKASSSKKGLQEAGQQRGQGGRDRHTPPHALLHLLRHGLGRLQWTPHLPHPHHRHSPRVGLCGGRAGIGCGCGRAADGRAGAEPGEDEVQLGRWG